MGLLKSFLIEFVSFVKVFTITTLIFCLLSHRKHFLQLLYLKTHSIDLS